MNNKYVLAGILTIVLVGMVLFVKSNTSHEESDKNHDDGNAASYEIYPNDVVSKIARKEDVVLLDVRTIEEYEQLHIKDSLLLPVQELSQQSLTSIGLGEDSKDKEIILYCRSGSRSKTAYDIMTSLGYTNIKSVAGGMVHWEEDKYPFTETGAYLGLGFSGGSDQETTSISGPKISVDRQLHDFGIIPQFGGLVETSFTVANTGTETLEIGTITTSCSCTSATIANSAIKPGESSELIVVFDPDLHEEPFDVFKRTVFLPTNDLNTPELEISVQVDIAEGE